MEDAKSRPSSSSVAPAHPFNTRALGEEEAGTDIGRGGHKMSTGRGKSKVVVERAEE